MLRVRQWRGGRRRETQGERHLRLIIDHPSIGAPIEGYPRNRYAASSFRPLETTLSWDPVRCFFLDGKCRRRKCFFDLMTRCLAAAQAAVHADTRPFYLPPRSAYVFVPLQSFRWATGRTTGGRVGASFLGGRKREARKEPIGRGLINSGVTNGVISGVGYIRSFARLTRGQMRTTRNRDKTTGIRRWNKAPEIFTGLASR
ncbi:hypothetical protein KM043_013211 [Ampulex compressa]|nr:hypothetical protein KM043_013211 [Ampulex compressa]